MNWFGIHTPQHALRIILNLARRLLHVGNNKNGKNCINACVIYTA